jgi:ABC-type sulfate/molybdate transport systems ATPase subunit
VIPNYLQFDCRFRRSSGFELNLEFEAGEGITGLVGPSGCGKTTTLLLIAGLLRPTSGSIRLREQVLVDSRASIFRPPESRKIGIVFQDFALFPHKNVADNLKYGVRRRHTKRLTFEQAVELCDLGDLLRRYPSTLSGGQQQRVAIARAILSDPDVLLMDEPFNAQDAELKFRIGAYIRQIVQDSGLPAILVSHDIECVKSMGCRMIQLLDGRLASHTEGNFGRGQANASTTSDSLA